MDFFGSFYGFFLGDNFHYYVAATALISAVVGFRAAPLLLWSIWIGVLMIGFQAPTEIFFPFLAIALFMNIKPLRALLLTSIIMKTMKALKIMPTISQTERTALEAGVVWVETDLFSGRPDFKKLMSEPYPELTSEEKAFLNGPVEKLCSMVDDWQTYQTRELDADAWKYMRNERFLGMIIPKEYGGLGFSAMAHSEVIMKLSSRSVPLAVTAMVPNSLGPAELLIHYGTDAQKNHYLPRLARGEEVPCFALTEPNAGSDAGSIAADGVLFKGNDGKLLIRLNWNKRWITLASISTVLGLAFRLRDPENLLGKGLDVGITCALIPSNAPGVTLGRRHDPLGVPFYNCPTQGKDVVVDIDHIVGGVEGAGQGWKMLMECLAAGRGISLPAQSTGGCKMMTRAVSAHASIRKQFGLPIGKFEAIEEPLARIAGYTYTIEAVRRYVCGALDKGLKPAVVTAIAKYNLTELGRKVAIDGMDVLGGAGISMGPRNLIAHQYIAAPIAITVEGANIMTRALIIFGQGALRAHPYAFREVNAIEKNDLKEFDDAFWGHVGHVIVNMFRSILLTITRGGVAMRWGGRESKYYRRLAWASASFAIMSDIAMASLGGKLKMKEKITGRFADILSWMFIATAILRRFRAEGSRKEDLPFLHFTLNHAFCQIQRAFDGLYANLEVPGLRWLFAGPIRWWSQLNPMGGEDKDSHTHKIATLLMKNGELRNRLTEGIYMPTEPDQALARLENAFVVIKRAEDIDHKLRVAVKAGTLPKLKGEKLIAAGFEKGVITATEKDDLLLSEKLRWDAIQVDDFSQEDYQSHEKDKPAGPHLKRA